MTAGNRERTICGGFLFINNWVPADRAWAGNFTYARFVVNVEPEVI